MPKKTFLDTLEGIVSGADKFTEGFLTSTFPKLAEPFSVIIWALFVIYCGWKWMQFYRGGVDILETAKTIIFMVFVFGFLNGEAATLSIYKTFTGSMDDIAKIVVAGEGLSDNTETVIGAMGDKILWIADEFMDNNLITKAGLVLSGFMMFLMTFVTLGIAVIYLQICKVGIAITMLFFPLFLSFIVFPATRQWFYSWINVMLSFAFTYLLLIGVVSFSLSSIYVTLEGTIKNPAAVVIAYFDTVGVLVNHLVLIILMLQVRGWAASLTQGLGPSGAGGRAASVAMKAIKAKLGMK